MLYKLVGLLIIVGFVTYFKTDTLTTLKHGAHLNSYLV